MKNWLSIVVGATMAFSLMSAGAAIADDEPSEPIPEDRQAQFLKQYGDEGIDANGDGTLTRDEVRTFFAEKRKQGRGFRRDRGQRGPGGSLDAMVNLLRTLEMFSGDSPPEGFDVSRVRQADRNDDGELSEREWAAFAAPKRERLLARLAKLEPEADADKDGEISESELAALKSEIRKRFLAEHPDTDTNGDGTLSEDELKAYQTRQVEERRAQILERNPEADLDGDGELSEEEARVFRATRRERSSQEHKWQRSAKPGRGGGESDK